MEPTSNIRQESELEPRSGLESGTGPRLGLESKLELESESLIETLPHDMREPMFPKARLIVVGSVYHQIPNQQPRQEQIGFGRPMDTEDQCFGPKKIRVTEEWVKIEAGWVTNCTYLLITNMEGKNLRVIPTKQEKEEILSRVVEVAILPVEDTRDRDMFSPPKRGPETFAILQPGEVLPFYPFSVERLRLRCLTGPALCSVVIYPS